MSKFKYSLFVLMFVVSQSVAAMQSGGGGGNYGGDDGAPAIGGAQLAFLVVLIYPLYVAYRRFVPAAVPPADEDPGVRGAQQRHAERLRPAERDDFGHCPLEELSVAQLHRGLQDRFRQVLERAEAMARQRQFARERQEFMAHEAAIRAGLSHEEETDRSILMQ